MGKANLEQSSRWMLEELTGFIGRCSGLQLEAKEDAILIHQRIDGKSLALACTEISELLKRSDSEGKEFVQLNFVDGRKILITDTLVGFKPFDSIGLDMSKIPKVVTTPDLSNVFEAIEEALSGEAQNDFEVEVLKKVYNSILQGGEFIGFELKRERRWLDRLVASRPKASA